MKKIDIVKINKNETWDSLTPRELRNAKIISVVFIVISFFIFMFLSKIVGTILLVTWMASGSGPFILGSKGSMKNMIYVLKIVEPGYSDWQDEDIEEQIRAIKECGYKWSETKGKVGFRHSKTGLFLIIEGLHYYKPEDIRRVYREVWSKEDPNHLRKIEATAQKLQELILNNASDKEIESILEKHQEDKK
ncbi:hypothetical protein KKC63_03150 [Patescibacteria group bacterium]|nr:hypothetical protein [Patescibacteria group bacterium]MBU4023465.1 hypothetical protein [Patescibacteria group bacterium]MBU4078178.1 hypothetical protein [Patescibacteria group bacterium]